MSDYICCTCPCSSTSSAAFFHRARITHSRVQGPFAQLFYSQSRRPESNYVLHKPNHAHRTHALHRISNIWTQRDFDLHSAITAMRERSDSDAARFKTAQRRVARKPRVPRLICVVRCNIITYTSTALQCYMRRLNAVLGCSIYTFCEQCGSLYDGLLYFP